MYAAFLHSSSAALSVKDSNGTFVSTLSMILYNVSTQLCATYLLIHNHFPSQCMNSTALNCEVWMEVI